MNRVARVWGGAIGAAAVLACCGVAAAGGPSVGFMTIEKKLAERETVAPLFAGGDDKSTLRDVIERLHDAAKRDDGLAGIVIRLSEPELTRTQVEELAQAIREVRESGKKVHLFTEIYGPSEVVLAAACDEAIVQQGGAVMLPGMYMEEMFLADTLRWAGLEPDFVQVGDYKGASEMMANAKPSPQWEQNINGLLDGLYAAMREEIKAGRGLDDAALDRAMVELAFGDADDAVRLGVLDRELDRLSLDEHLESVYGDDFVWDKKLSPAGSKAQRAQMGMFEAFAEIMKAMEGQSRQTTRDTIAVLHIDGAIADGKSGGGGLLGGGSNVGALTIREALKKIEDDENIKGVIVRVNSPGGSAIASENIWQGVRRVAQKKPVWTSVGSMAASGGYYIAVAGEKIFVNPSSVVGSIGVVGGKVAMQGLYDKLKVNVVPRARGPMAGLFGGRDPWTSEQREFIRKRMTETYDLFVSRVKSGREGIDVSKTAEGRLFAGEKAVELKMADKIGGLADALASMAEKLDLQDGAYDVMDFPEPMSLEELLQGALPMASAQAAAGELPATLKALRELVGAPAFDQVSTAISALLTLRTEPVVLVSPSVILVK